MYKWIVCVVFIFFMGVIHPALAETTIKRIPIDKVSAGNPLRFGLSTHGKTQYAAYYDAKRQMTVAKRTLGEDKWTYAKFDSWVGWDNHNYVTMAVDRDGNAHVSGNMHCVKLIYFRTDKPGDMSSFKRLAMTGKRENSVTYPKFLNDHEGNLIFSYRDGRSGNGDVIYNKYDLKTKTWSRLLDTPLLDGEGKCNAYHASPRIGPDGLFHMIWIWRETVCCSTCRDVSYARSKDLVNWETAAGKPVKLPLRLAERSLIVDPIPIKSGFLYWSLSFDASSRPIVTYNKNDKNGHMQIYASRFEEGTWVRRQLTKWNKKVHFSGTGSMGFVGIDISRLKKVKPGVLTLTYHHKDYGKGRFFIDEKTLERVDMDLEIPPEYPAELNKVKSDFIGANASMYKGMMIRRANDSGDSGDEKVRYILQWETLGRNRDKAPPKPPPDSVLELIEIRR